MLLGAALGAAAEEGEGVSLDGEISLVADLRELFFREADIYLDHAMTLVAGQVMVVAVPADAIVVRAIGEVDAVEQALIDELFYRAVDGRATQVGIIFANILPQVINGKIGFVLSELNEPLFDKPTRACATLTDFIERGTDLFFDGMCLGHVAYSLSGLATHGVEIACAGLLR
ncbi:hypothetical protein Krac_7875 [Ktedonobacter racemifer DSM 44963]|uniref:Uncharacterized protein n=1 Tax=Ktedonobacter racemifer DSM 44963 TaxID=485913 RepID=D6TLC3_KTERA|nr:hypothetical protein Krac_7875 [Ktedonobacter racemifer DSM 44963]